MKKRVSLTLDSNILSSLDRLVDGLHTRSRSHAVEKILKQSLADSRSAVILAGGKPEKLWVPALGTYRPLVDIGGRKLIEDNIIKLREAGFSNIIVIGFPQIASKIYEVLGNGENFGVKINYIEELEERGTAKSLEMTKNLLGSDFLFLPCDQFFDFDLRKLKDFHLQQNGVVTLGVHTRTSFDWRSGIVQMDGYRIIDFEEKPDKPKTRLSSAFVGFMKAEIFDYIPPGKLYWSLQENIFPKLAKENKLIGYPVAGNWVNVHTKEDVKKVIKIRSEG